MKLIYAIVNNDDAHSVSSSLTKSGFQATKLASTGGFLMSGNTTFLICSEDDKIDEIIEIIKDHSHKRKQFVPSAASWRRTAGRSCGGLGVQCHRSILAYSRWW